MILEQALTLVSSLTAHLNRSAPVISLLLLAPSNLRFRVGISLPYLPFNAAGFAPAWRFNQHL